MAIVVDEPNILILEPVKCGTTWIRETLTECGVDWSIAKPVSGVCPRHSYREHYKGDFSRVYCPIRNPYSWLASYYNFHKPLKALPFLDNSFYGHRPFGKSMPSSFEDFVEFVIVTRASVSGYFRPFLHGGPGILRQERLRIDLIHTLKSHEVQFDENVILNSAKRNESNSLGSWPQVSGRLVSLFRRQEQEMLSHYEDMPSGVA